MADPLERRRERARRVSVREPHPRAISACRLSDWQGASFLLSTATGKTEMVENLSHLWSVAERLSGRPCDPLDPALLAPP